MTPARAVVFDFDGVLADTEGLHLAAFQHVFGARGWSLDRDTYFSGYLGCTDHDLVRQYAGQHHLALEAADVDTLVGEKCRVYEARIAEGSVLYPGAPAIVRRLGQAFRLAVASGSFRGEILAILGAHALSPLFGAIVGADDVRRSKPAPDPYAAAVAALGVAAAQAVAIEDSVWGLTSAQAAGLRTIAITTSHPRAELHPADVIVDDLDEITVDLVDELIARP